MTSPDDIVGDHHDDERDWAGEREGRADRREGRADLRDSRADLREQRAGDRDERANERDHADANTLRQVENLVEANTKSNDTMRHLVEKVRLDAEMRERKIDLLDRGLRATHRLLIMVGAGLVLLASLGIVNAVNLSNARRNAAITAQTATDAEQTYALLFDCINPEGACGKRSADQQRKVLEEIKLYELTVLYCARINPQIADPAGKDFLACAKRLYPSGPVLADR